MITKLLRERLTYTAMSVFVAWHAAATVIAPAPDNSVIAIALRPIFQPYLEPVPTGQPLGLFRAVGRERRRASLHHRGCRWEAPHLYADSRAELVPPELFLAPLLVLRHHGRNRHLRGRGCRNIFAESTQRCARSPSRSRSISNRISHPRTNWTASTPGLPNSSP